MCLQNTVTCWVKQSLCSQRYIKIKYIFLPSICYTLQAVNWSELLETISDHILWTRYILKLFLSSDRKWVSFLRLKFVCYMLYIFVIPFAYIPEVKMHTSLIYYCMMHASFYVIQCDWMISLFYSLHLDMYLFSHWLSWATFAVYCVQSRTNWIVW